MRFKQARFLKFHESVEIILPTLNDQLNKYSFISCLPSLPKSMGWIPPIETEETLVQEMQGYYIICLQVEDKLLPASVVRQELTEVIHEMEQSQQRTIKQKERLRLKDEVMITLLPKAFSKFTKIYAFIDKKLNYLVINTTSSRRLEEFIFALKKCIEINLEFIAIPSLNKILTNWLKEKNHPADITIEETCVLQDPNKISRMIRCKNQNLYVPAVQSFMQDGYAIKQLSVCWKDRIQFNIADDFSFSSIAFQEDTVEAIDESLEESPKLYFFTNFILYSAILSELAGNLVGFFNTI